MSYQAVLDPVVEELARTSSFGPALTTGYSEVTEFAQTDMARYACVDSPEDWGLELSFGGALGVSYSQGLEFALHEGGIEMNCLNQVSLAPEAAVVANANLIRHVGECHGGETDLEDTLFLELGASAGVSLGIQGQVGVAYTAGLSKGILNRTLPRAIESTASTYRELIADIFDGRPAVAVDIDGDPEAHAALCNAVDDVEHSMDEAMGGGTSPTSDFLGHFIETSSDCHVEDDDHHDELGHDEHDGHEDQWSICSTMSLKQMVGMVRTRIIELREASSGPMRRWALGQLDVLLEIVDNVLSGCDHVEFQVKVGVGIGTGFEPHIGLENHNYYGRIGFEGTDEELGEALAAAIRGSGDPEEVDNACEEEHGDELQEEFSSTLAEEDVCEAAEVATSTVGILDALQRDPRIQYETVDHLRVYGFDVPLPENTLLNYTLACGLGPLRNTLETLWAP
jgi:hypothetical protein